MLPLQCMAFSVSQKHYKYMYHGGRIVGVIDAFSHIMHVHLAHQAVFKYPAHVGRVWLMVYRQREVAGYPYLSTVDAWQSASSATNFSKNTRPTAVSAVVSGPTFFP